MSLRLRWAAATAVLAFGMGSCAGAAPLPPKKAVPIASAAPKAAPPVEAPTAEPLEEPPPPGFAQDLRLPPVQSFELPSGLSAMTLRSRALPLVEIRLVVSGGRVAEGEHVGIAAITLATMLEGGTTAMSGREVRARLDALGATIDTEARADAAVIRVRATPATLNDTLELLAAMVQRPAFDTATFAEIRKREIARVMHAAHVDPAWSAQMALFQSLFTLPTGHHPYASFDALPEDLEKIQVADCRDFYRRVFVPKNTRLVFAGDIVHDDVKGAVERIFSGYRGGESEMADPEEVMPPESLKITVVNRPKSSESEILAGVLGPPVSDENFAAFGIVAEVLGGLKGRLEVDLRDNRKIATYARASVIPLRSGPSVLLIRSRTNVENTAAAVERLIAQLETLATTEPTAPELDMAQRSANGSLSMSLGTLGHIADEVARVGVLELPDDYLAARTKNLRSITADEARAVAAEYVRAGHLVIAVSTDASAVASALGRFAEVRVVDAEKGFGRVGPGTQP